MEKQAVISEELKKFIRKQGEQIKHTEHKHYQEDKKSLETANQYFSNLN